jgi:hypothetical protein
MGAVELPVLCRIHQEKESITEFAEVKCIENIFIPDGEGFRLSSAESPRSTAKRNWGHRLQRMAFP